MMFSINTCDSAACRRLGRRLKFQSFDGHKTTRRPKDVTQTDVCRLLDPFIVWDAVPNKDFPLPTSKLRETPSLPG